MFFVMFVVLFIGPLFPFFRGHVCVDIPGDVTLCFKSGHVQYKIKIEFYFEDVMSYF